MTVRRMLSEMDSRELTRWNVFLREDADRREQETERQRVQRQLDQ